MKEKGVGSDYAYRTNVQKIDVECLQWFLGEQKISLKKLANETSVTAGTIRKWMKRGEMPAYLIDEICEALAIESVCDMRENAEMHCAEPVTTFRYKDAEEDPDAVKIHAMICVEFKVHKELFEQILNAAIDEHEMCSDLYFDDATAEMIIDNGHPANDGHHIPFSLLLSDAVDAGVRFERNEKGELIKIERKLN